MDETRAVDDDDATGRTLSAGEVGPAGDSPKAVADTDQVEVIVGEIPDAGDPTHMLWTARCGSTGHGLLGTFPQRAWAEDCRTQHLLEEHAPPESK
jgi:hypothetical protein